MTDRDYLKSLGARALSEANDLKRTPEALASELAYNIDTVRSVIAGEAPVATVRQLLEDMSRIYPVSFNNLWIEQNDTDQGARIMRGTDSNRTSRIFDRPNRDGLESAYYDYRDTAMSRMAPFKPEWIQPLRTVSDADPYNPEVAFNKGHLMHQMTFFVGAVNFYWELDGEKHCVKMNTGDSNYITPFVPHSFTSRDPNNLGLIIAVTFAGRVRMALDEFSRIDGETAEEISGDLRDPISAFEASLRRHMAAESLTVEQLVGEMASEGFTAQRANDIGRGNSLPTAEEIEVLARILAINPSSLQVRPLTKEQEVVICPAELSMSRQYPNNNQPAYRLKHLARTPHQPQLRGFQVIVLDDLEMQDSEMRHGLHEYVYNYGSEPVTLKWQQDRVDFLEPGDSVYLSPMVRHAFGRVQGCKEGQLLIVRVPGGLSEEAITEFAAFVPAARSRVTRETTKWF
tara:strand:+ start:2510 stop:3883 length:1374 start_codon:yes stop_codon:yes gene_type:complete